jgi:hypothetical protein
MSVRAVVRFGKVIGKVEGDTLIKKVSPPKHFFRALNAWGIDLLTLQQLSQEGVKRVKVIAGDTFYEADIATILSKGIVEDFGYGEQVFLPLEYWKEYNRWQIKLC